MSAELDRLERSSSRWEKKLIHTYGFVMPYTRIATPIAPAATPALRRDASERRRTAIMGRIVKIGQADRIIPSAAPATAPATIHQCSLPLSMYFAAAAI